MGAPIFLVLRASEDLNPALRQEHAFLEQFGGIFIFVDFPEYAHTHTHTHLLFFAIHSVFPLYCLVLGMNIFGQRDRKHTGIRI